MFISQLNPSLYLPTPQSFEAQCCCDAEMKRVTAHKEQKGHTRL